MSDRYNLYKNASGYIIVQAGQVISAHPDFSSAKAALDHLTGDDVPGEYPTHRTPTYRNINWVPRLDRWQARISEKQRQSVIGTYRTQAQAIDGYKARVGAAPVLVLPIEPPSTTTRHVLGVTWSDRLKRWIVKTKANGRMYRVGRFRTQAEAIKAQKRAKELLTPPERHEKREQELPSIDRPAYEDYKDLL